METLDRFGRVWSNPIWDKCPVCGQPDNCGECNHKKLNLKDVIELGGFCPEQELLTHFGIRPVVAITKGEPDAGNSEAGSKPG